MDRMEVTKRREEEKEESWGQREKRKGTEQTNRGRFYSGAWTVEKQSIKKTRSSHGTSVAFIQFKTDICVLAMPKREHHNNNNNNNTNNNTNARHPHLQPMHPHLSPSLPLRLLPILLLL